MVPLGTEMPAFSLQDTVSGKRYSSDDISGSCTVIMFICNHCPYVKHLLSGIVETANAGIRAGAEFLAISSNDCTSYPEDSPEQMKANALLHHFPFPYLYDADQSVAMQFGAACTPDFFVYDKNRKLCYRGQFDDSRPGNGIAVTGNDLSHAIRCILHGNPVSGVQRPSLGCNIKWKS